MTEVFETKDTSDIQIGSLIRYMAAIGYEPSFDHRDQLTGFYQPKFKEAMRVSVNSAIQRHNTASAVAFNRIRITRCSIIDYVEKYGDDDFIELFAAACKIVQRVKMYHCRKKGVVIQNHNIKFMTKRDAYQHGF